MLLADAENFQRLQAALKTLEARRIAVPRFDPALLGRGHAVHFRCDADGVKGLRVDVMTRLRELPGFETLWRRRTTFQDEAGTEFHLLSVPDLVQAKKTQRNKDWPVIELLVTIHHRENAKNPQAEWIDFWLREARTPELLRDLVKSFPNEAAALRSERPLLALAADGKMDALRAELDAEVRAEQAKDREYWEPLRREIEQFRREERTQS